MFSEPAQLLVGLIEFLAGFLLGWLANDYIRRPDRRKSQSAAAKPSRGPAQPTETSASALLGELTRIVGAHTQSVESFQKSLDEEDSVSSNAGQASVAPLVQMMRDANRQFDSDAQVRSENLSGAAERDPSVFADLLKLLSGHRGETANFDNLLGGFNSAGTMQQLQALTAAAVQQVLESKRRLESELATAQQRIEEQVAQLKAAEQDARIDSLTRLPNRRSFDEQLVEVHSLFERQNVIYSMIILDIDNFKTFNDTHGHGAGDAVLQVVGKVLQTQKRPTDHASRIGGEEFAVILQATSAQHGQLVAERMRKRIETSTVHFDGKELNVTASAGVAQIESGVAAKQLFEQADLALYSAKKQGRNCVSVLSLEDAQAIDETAEAGAPA